MHSVVQQVITVNGKIRGLEVLLSRDLNNLMPKVDDIIKEPLQLSPTVVIIIIIRAFERKSTACRQIVWQQ